MSLLPSRTSLFDDLFRDMASGFYIRPLHGDPLPSQIRLDLKESDGNYVLQAELPGVAKEDIHVDIHGKQVTLKAEIRQFDSQNKDERTLRSERYFGSVSRTLELPVEVALDKVSARFENGILTLQLPKQVETPAPHRVTIE
ncbi:MULTISPECIES: Hsp20/alpha crystallin family protein [Aeromonas]|uniref:Hsp20/alpha crystallin family protein n=1 Tax=Aeromonas TaxID=642 RepID=UPI000CCF7C2B|nr:MULTISPECIES: Hsp20/alpha crystallin family protein [Aeromonas]MBL0440819.1 Hsp20/alpha crystallin family protein [Aeromonas veronii]MBL0642086.1 Hsp20/alpha crystallin family protein [Aeromonas veronii]MCR3961758.1 Hsp20/alpha crystallin family protein [Aeromonas veronii]MCX4046786.1 Hsp20/alpha crystallin family protein [Aeromonas veronii]PNW69150.1 heat-shock protein Hsp20 [Aeromonas veronii]